MYRFRGQICRDAPGAKVLEGQRLGFQSSGLTGKQSHGKGVSDMCGVFSGKLKNLAPPPVSAANPSGLVLDC